MIKNDCPKEVPPATPEERAAILDLLSQYVSTNKVLVFDDEKRRGTYHHKPQKKKMQSNRTYPAR